MLSRVVATPSELVSVEQTAKLIALNKQVNKTINSDIDISDTDYTPMIVSGPSGVGKGTMVNSVTELYPNKFAFSVSFTTRPIRGEEVDGVHYNFVTQEVFEQMIKDDKFIEWAQVHTNYYGTSKEMIEKI